MIDKHLGRSSPVFTYIGNPEKFISLINKYGILAKVMQAIKCPCVNDDGSPSIYCNICNGDGFIYRFQRKFLQLDEDTEYRDWINDFNDPRTEMYIYPFRVPILQPIKVERVSEPELGGIVEYDILEFDSEKIKIGKKNPTDRFPLHYEKMRVSYYFDNYVKIENELVEVDVNNKILTTKSTLYKNEPYSFSNVFQIHGNIAEIIEIKNINNNHLYTNYKFNRNKIYINLNPNEPNLEENKISVSYYYVPPCKVLPADFDIRTELEKFNTSLKTGTIRIALEPWYEVSQGDIIILLTYFYYNNDIITHRNNLDTLSQFNVVKLDDIIIDENGTKYYLNIDYIHYDFNKIKWIGNQPEQGTKFSIRYSYNPTFIVFQDEPIFNNLTNKNFPVIVYAKLWNQTLQKDLMKVY
jgi:hypothetical protein